MGIVASQPTSQPASYPFLSVPHRNTVAPLPSKPPNPGPVAPFLINLASFYSCSRVGERASSDQVTKQKQRKGVRHGAAVHSLAHFSSIRNGRKTRVRPWKKTATPDVNGASFALQPTPPPFYPPRKKKTPTPTPTPALDNAHACVCVCARARALTSTRATTDNNPCLR